ncbi:MAG TPA: PEP-CTERM sorting domain-containing protein [Thermoguttaceae bacterium]
MKLRTIAIIFALLTCATFAKAEITYWYCDPRDTSVLDTTVTDWSEDPWTYEYNMTMSGVQYSYPGYMDGYFHLDSPEDPTIVVTNNLDNDTTFTWTDYHIDVIMNHPFTLFSAFVNIPGGWTHVITPPVLIGSDYVGRIDYYAGTSVPVGNTLELGYKVSFSGFTSFSYTQVMTPTPEPSVFVLLACGLLGLLAFRKRST